MLSTLKERAKRLVERHGAEVGAVAKVAAKPVAKRNVTVRAAVSAPAVSNIPSSRRRPSFLPFARSWSPFPARIRVAREAIREGASTRGLRGPLPRR